MNGLTGWKGRDGNYYVKAKSSLNKKKVDANPNMEPQRQARNHLALASQAATEIRSALQPFASQYADAQAHSRLTQTCMKAMMKHCHGPCPEAFDYAALPTRIAGFPMNRTQPLSRYATQLQLIHSDADTGWADLTIKGWHLQDNAIHKSGATHLRWIAVTAGLTAQPIPNKRNRVITSPWMDIHHPQPWTTPIEYGPFITPGGAAIIALVLETAQYASNCYYHLETIKAMDIL